MNAASSSFFFIVAVATICEVRAVSLSATVETSRLDDGTSWRDAIMEVSAQLRPGASVQAAMIERTRGPFGDTSLMASTEMRVHQSLALNAHASVGLSTRVSPRWQAGAGAEFQFTDGVSGFASIRQISSRAGSTGIGKAGVRWTDDWASLSGSVIYARSVSARWGVAVEATAEVSPGTRVAIGYTDAADDVTLDAVRARAAHISISHSFEPVTVSAGVTIEERDGPDRIAATIGMIFRAEP